MIMKGLRPTYCPGSRRQRIAPHAAHYDETESYPEESIKAILESR